jgi:osmoprotectant transport system ATP-binding protein
MIRVTLEGVRKAFGSAIAVRDLDLDIEPGSFFAIVGPSGCGKTTTMRMVNRMIEPSAGTVTVDGSDVMDVPAPELRRRIGYVIQQVGLFPHRTIAKNIATVPELLGWDEQRTHERVEELIATVGLEPSLADRYPHQLSGGQRQRVGVARALAVDPPIMLMDEPFGAVDPLVRGKLQDEFLRLQQLVRKTIVFVTHDIDEAITIGDRIAILAQGGRLQQFATPDEVLAEPANAFVADFLGQERSLKRLALRPVSEVTAERGPRVRPDGSRSEAEDAARAAGTDWLVVVRDDGYLVGWTWLGEVERSVRDAEVRPFRVRVRATDSLRVALDAMVTSSTGVAVRVKALDDGDRYEGILTPELLRAELR